MSKSDSEQLDKLWWEMFTGHDRWAAMDVYWSVAIFTSDRTSRPVGSSLPANEEKLKLYKSKCWNVLNLKYRYCNNN